MKIAPAIPAPEPVERAARCAWDEALRAVLEPAEQATLAALDQWLEEPDRPYALIHGSRPSRRAAIAAHLVHAQQAGGRFEAHFVPFGPGLQLERDLLALLTSRLLHDYAGGPPRRLREHLVEECLREGRAEGQPPVLLAVAGVEEAEPLVAWPALFRVVGQRVKVLTTVEGDAGAACAWLDRLGFDPSRTLVLALPPVDPPCEDARAYLEQAGAPLAAFAPLVTPEHLARWMKLPHAFFGFVADLERVRQKAVSALGRAADPEALALGVRAALVEASVNDCARREDHEAPVGVEHIDLGATLADQRQQAGALTALGAAMAPGPARAEVLAWALDAARGIADDSFRGDALCDLAAVTEGDAAYALAREAVTAYRAAADEPAALLVAVPVLPPREGLSLAHEALWRLRVSGGDPGDLALFAGRFPRPVAEGLWSDAEALPVPARAQVLAALAASLGDPDRVREAFSAVEASVDPYDMRTARDVERLIPLLDRGQAERARRLAQAFGEHGVELFEALVPRLAALGEHVDEVLAALPEEPRLRAMARALPFSPEPARLRARILDALGEAEPLARFGLLFEVGPALAAAGETDALLSMIEPLSDVHCWTALTFLARHDPTRAPSLARRALEAGLHFGAGEADRLLELIPLAAYLPVEGAASLFGVLLDVMASEYRASALKGDRVSLGHVVPLLARLGGERGLRETAHEVVRVAAWFP